MNRVTINQVERTVSIKLVHIESNYYYASPIQPVDEPKERV